MGVLRLLVTTKISSWLSYIDLYMYIVHHVQTRFFFNITHVQIFCLNPDSGVEMLCTLYTALSALPPLYLGENIPKPMRGDFLQQPPKLLCSGFPETESQALQTTCNLSPFGWAGELEEGMSVGGWFLGYGKVKTTLPPFYILYDSEWCPTKFASISFCVTLPTLKMLGETNRTH